MWSTEYEFDVYEEIKSTFRQIRDVREEPEGKVYELIVDLVNEAYNGGRKELREQIAKEIEECDLELSDPGVWNAGGIRKHCAKIARGK